MAQDHGDGGHIAWLDGPRGVAALWVLLSHAQILSGMREVPLLSWGSLAVDLFMLLSGFLMAHHYRLRRAREPWFAPGTWTAFWLRRWFRIAPLYYLLLVVALALGPWIGEARHAIATLWPATGTAIARYDDQSALNVITHASFVFGALPAYAFRTPLPDWSIGLEMQFYLAFPFIMMLLARLGPLLGGLPLMAACLGLWLDFPGFFHAFAMPAFLPIKLYIFLIGAWAALGRENSMKGGNMKRGSMKGGAKGGMSLPLALAAAVCAGVWGYDHTSESLARLLMVVAFFYLMNDGSLPGSMLLRPAITAARRLLTWRPSRVAGDISYGLYLVHLLVLIPVAGWLAAHPAYLHLPAVARFALCALLAGAISLPTAWVLHHLVERPGIRAGKRTLELLRRRTAMAVERQAP